MAKFVWLKSPNFHRNDTCRNIYLVANGVRLGWIWLSVQGISVRYGVDGPVLKRTLVFFDETMTLRQAMRTLKAYAQLGDHHGP